MPNDFPMVDVLRLRPLEGHRLWVRFTDGSEGVRDLSDVIAEGGPMVQPLKAQDYFNRVFVELADAEVERGIVKEGEVGEGGGGGGVSKGHDAGEEEGGHNDCCG